MTTFARACPVSLSRNPLSPGIEATPKTDLSLSRSLVHRQTWRLTGYERARSEFLLIYTKNLSMSGRPAGRPAVVTLLRGLYLWNRKPD